MAQPDRSLPKPITNPDQVMLKNGQIYLRLFLVEFHFLLVTITAIPPTSNTTPTIGDQLTG